MPGVVEVPDMESMDHQYVAPAGWYERWAGPKIQHSVIAGDDIVSFLVRDLQDLSDDDRVYPFSRAQVKARWDRILIAIGIDPGALPPRSLRGGGTVHLYESTLNIGLVLWQGRWQNEKSLAYYLQEALVHRLLSSLPLPVRANIMMLQDAFDFVISY